MSQQRFTFSVWQGLRCACSSALAGEVGGDFTQIDMDHIEKANEWLEKIGDDRDYFYRLPTEPVRFAEAATQTPNQTVPPLLMEDYLPLDN